MACVELPSSANADSEMEEGEIVDEVDYLSDISSEEEFLLRQRLKVLENYNNALERKEAKRTSIGSGKDHGNNDALYGLSDISGNDADDGFLKTTYVITKQKKHIKPHHRQKHLKQTESRKNKEYRKKNNRNKIKGGFSSDSETSEFSDDDYKNKRRKLADAVSLNIVKNDTSTLKDRLSKMLCMSKAKNNNKEAPIVTPECNNEPQNNEINNDHRKATPELNSNTVETQTNFCTDDLSKVIEIEDSPKDTMDSSYMDKKEDNSVENSDDDLELLRQHALKTKSTKTEKHRVPKHQKVNNKPGLKTNSEDEDSDTTELRMICLKSTLLKKAIQLKRKQKLQKRLSYSAKNNDFDICQTENLHADNSTDIESVDMDIGSDGEDKGKKLISDCTLHGSRIHKKNITNSLHKENELEENEDLLRAKLLTSLSKNLPNLVDISVLNSAFGKETKTKTEKKKCLAQPNVGVEEKKFIIELGESDSEGEHEATKNLTKMHIKLSEQAEFQQKLDQFLKSTRLEVEKRKLPDVVQAPAQKPPEKLIVKTMNHLPKSEQIEYKNLVKRMAELEKIKQARQNLINVTNKDGVAKDTLKPSNLVMASYKVASPKKIEEKIALSRKRIAEESAQMLKLKEEATKLSQRYKIAATELKNIATAITINKKQQKTVQNSLTKIRHQHQMLLKSSPSKHSNQNLTLCRSIENTLATIKFQKENEPLNVKHKKCDVIPSVKISVANDLRKEVVPISPRSPVQIEIPKDRRHMKPPKSPHKERVVELKKHSPKKNCYEQSMSEFVIALDNNNTEFEQISPRLDNYSHTIRPDLDDYKSPLDAFHCKKCNKKPRIKYCFRD